MSLRLTYIDVIKEVSEYLGTGDIPVDRDKRKAQEIVNKGYRKFLFPRNASNGKRHYWSFLETQQTLTTKSGQYRYMLPENLDKIKRGFIYSTDTGYSYLKSISNKALLQYRALSDSSSHPSMYTVMNDKYSKDKGTQKEVWFVDTPDSIYELSYSYYFIPPELEDDDDLFVGGAWYDETILACALAAAEVKYNHVIGDMSKHADRLVKQAIMADQSTKPDRLGLNLDPGIQHCKIKRPLPAVPMEDVYTD